MNFQVKNASLLSHIVYFRFGLVGSSEVFHLTTDSPTRTGDLQRQAIEFCGWGRVFRSSVESHVELLPDRLRGCI